FDPCGMALLLRAGAGFRRLGGAASLGRLLSGLRRLGGLLGLRGGGTSRSHNINSFGCCWGPRIRHGYFTGAPIRRSNPNRFSRDARRCHDVADHTQSEANTESAMPLVRASYSGFKKVGQAEI